MSTESETFENLQFKERLFEKTGSFTQSIFVFQHGTNTIYIHLYIYSLGAYHLTFRSCGGLTFFLPNQKTFFARNKNLFLFGYGKSVFFSQILPNISRWKIQDQIIFFFVHFSGQYTIVLHNMQRQYILKKKTVPR
jgi:hypothetical protein